MNRLRGVSEACASLVDWWLVARDGDGGIPTRRSFHPGDHKASLPYLFILERLAPDNVTARVVGTKIDDWFGIGVTGRNLLELPKTDDTRDRHAQYYNTLLDTPCAGRLSRHAFRADGTEYVYDSIHLPMADDSGAPRYLIGAGMTDLHVPGYGAPVHTLHERTLHRGFEFVDIGFGSPRVSREATAS